MWPIMVNSHKCVSSKTPSQKCCVLIRLQFFYSLWFFSSSSVSSTTMAVHTVRSPATHLHTGTSRNISPSHRNPNDAIRFSFRSPKLRRFISVSSSLREGNEHGKENSVRALEVKKIPEDSPLLPSTNSNFHFPRH